MAAGDKAYEERLKVIAESPVWKDIVEANKRAAKEAQAAWDEYARNTERVAGTVAEKLVGVMRGARFSFKEMLQDMAAALLESQLTQLLTSLFQQIGGGPGTCIASLFNAFAGGFATGGTIPGRKFGLVGEEGPELIHAGAGPLTITPMSGLGTGGGGNVIVNNYNTFTIPSRDSVRQEIGAMLPEIAKVNRASMREASYRRQI